MLLLPVRAVAIGLLAKPTAYLRRRGRRRPPACAALHQVKKKSAAARSKARAESGPSSAPPPRARAIGRNQLTRGELHKCRLDNTFQHLAILNTTGIAPKSRIATAQAISRLEDGGIGTARVNNLAAVWGHPQIAARKKWMLVETTAGSLPALVPPGTADWSPRSDPVPELGQHTSAILRELNIDRWPGQPTPKTQWSGGSSPSWMTARDQERRSVSDRVCGAATL